MGQSVLRDGRTPFGRGVGFRSPNLECPGESSHILTGSLSDLALFSRSTCPLIDGALAPLNQREASPNTYV
uniref:Uncharacterized protein n=1 Tax=Neogobius melanostomus TaxID=47308 RepID=A0A8C6WQ81_9GOBI